jgi:hypothetical protein
MHLKELAGGAAGVHAACDSCPVLILLLAYPCSLAQLSSPSTSKTPTAVVAGLLPGCCRQRLSTGPPPAPLAPQWAHGCCCRITGLNRAAVSSSKVHWPSCRAHKCCCWFTGLAYAAVGSSFCSLVQFQLPQQLREAAAHLVTILGVDAVTPGQHERKGWDRCT